MKKTMFMFLAGMVVLAGCPSQQDNKAPIRAGSRPGTGGTAGGPSPTVQGQTSGIVYEPNAQTCTQTFSDAAGVLAQMTLTSGTVGSICGLPPWQNNTSTGIYFRGPIKLPNGLFNAVPSYNGPAAAGSQFTMDFYDSISTQGSGYLEISTANSPGQTIQIQKAGNSVTIEIDDQYERLFFTNGIINVGGTGSQSYITGSFSFTTVSGPNAGQSVPLGAFQVNVCDLFACQ